MALAGSKPLRHRAAYHAPLTGSGMGQAGFLHCATRALDPQVHTGQGGQEGREGTEAHTGDGGWVGGGRSATGASRLMTRA